MAPPKVGHIRTSAASRRLWATIWPRRVSIVGPGGAGVLAAAGEVVAVTSTEDALSPGERTPRRRATLAAVAAEAGVSLPTVSKVVNGRPDVSPTTRARVEQLLDRHKYPRNGPRLSRRSGLIDLVFNGLDSPWAVEIRRGVEEGGAAQATAIAVPSARHGDARPPSWPSTIASH